MSLREKASLLVTQKPILTKFGSLVLQGLKEVWVLGLLTGEETLRRLPTLLLLAQLLLEDHLFLVVDRCELLAARLIVGVLESLHE